MKPSIVQNDFYETENGFELFVGRFGQGSWKKVLAGAWGAVLLDDGGNVSVVLFASFEKSEVEAFIKKHKHVEPESCARCYKSFIPSDDGGLCLSCCKRS